MSKPKDSKQRENKGYRNKETPFSIVSTTRSEWGRNKIDSGRDKQKRLETAQ